MDTLPASPFRHHCLARWQKHIQRAFGFQQLFHRHRNRQRWHTPKTGQQYTSWFGKKIPESQVIQATHQNETKDRYWHKYSPEQIQTTIDLCEVLMQQYKTITTILGHDEISVGRKLDPGPAFPMDKLRSLFLEDRQDNTQNNDPTQGYVSVPKLNIREMPSIKSDLAHAPLNPSTQVHILQTHHGWHKVQAKIRGWVSAHYIEQQMPSDDAKE